jgi:sugar O-acyltransferase (sialic acid O-acetyltransferase NeuD family)
MMKNGSAPILLHKQGGVFLKKIVIYGSSGFGREVVHLIEAINQNNKEWDIIGFIDDDKTKHGNQVNGYEVLGDKMRLEEYQGESINVAIGVGVPKYKRVIAELLKDMKNVRFPNLIHPGVFISPHNQLGQGLIICEGNILTCNITIKDFVTVNLNSTIGHDTIIDEYTTILPNCSISGNVYIGKEVDLGTNATVIPSVSIGNGSIIGAGAVVVKDIPAYCTAVGMPAKPIKYHEDVSLN